MRELDNIEILLSEYHAAVNAAKLAARRHSAAQAKVAGLSLRLKPAELVLTEEHKAKVSAYLDLREKAAAMISFTMHIENAVYDLADID